MLFGSAGTIPSPGVIPQASGRNPRASRSDDQTPRTMRSIRLRNSTDTAPPADGDLSPRLRRAYLVSERAARQVLRRRFRVVALVKRAYLKLGEHSSAMAQVQADFHTMLRMVRAWAVRDYRTVPWKTLVYIVAAIIYFVNPVDLIPDVLAGIGFIDDAAVAAAVVRAVHEQLLAFREWESHARIEGAEDGTNATKQASVAA